jgi:membrane-bound lytic murein transglycosylase D
VRVPPAEVFLDEILASPMFGDADFEAEVARWVEYWRTEAAAAVPVFLERMSSFEQTVDSALQENRLPASLRYLPFIESGYNPYAASTASAVGLWQFMGPTAQEMGMEVSRLLDQRRDPIRSTEAAVAFLTELRERFGSWFFALAAYNSGPNRVRRVLQQFAPADEPTDSLFWSVRRHFPKETQDFVPKFVGAILVAGSPEAHGYEPVRRLDPFLYDDVTVPDATTLDVVARAAEVPLGEIERLNPQFLRGMTPPGRPSGLRVPPGRGSLFQENYARIPVAERVTFLEHRVESGETLSHIAVRYGVQVADLNAANPGLRERYLRIGAVLTVPVAQSARGSSTGS